MSEIQRLIAAATDAQLKLRALLAGVDPTALEEEPAVGVWPVRNVAGHLGDWIDEIIAAAEHALGDPAPAHHPIPDFEAFNTERALVHRAEPWANVLVNLDVAVERALAVMSRISDEQLDEPLTYPWGDRGTLAGLLRGIPDHHNEHIPAIEHWLARRNATP